VQNGEPLPSLGEEWMSAAELEEREVLRRNRQMRLRAACRAIGGAHAPVQPGTVAVPNNADIVLNDVMVVPQLEVVGGAQVPALPAPVVVDVQVAPASTSSGRCTNRGPRTSSTPWAT
jgi:hypothetical protein